MKQAEQPEFFKTVIVSLFCVPSFCSKGIIRLHADKLFHLKVPMSISRLFAGVINCSADTKKHTHMMYLLSFFQLAF